MAVTKIAFGTGVAVQGAIGGQGGDGVDFLADIFPLAAPVHADESADTGGNADQVFEAAEASSGVGEGEEGNPCSGFHRDAVGREGDAGEIGADFYDAAAKPGVIEEDVGAAADDAVGDGAGREAGNDFAQLVDGAGLEVAIGEAADAPPGMPAFVPTGLLRVTFFQFRVKTRGIAGGHFIR